MRSCQSEARSTAWLKRFSQAAARDSAVATLPAGHNNEAFIAYRLLGHYDTGLVGVDVLEVKTLKNGKYSKGRVQSIYDFAYRQGHNHPDRSTVALLGTLAGYSTAPLLKGELGGVALQAF